MCLYANLIVLDVFNQVSQSGTVLHCRHLLTDRSLFNLVFLTFNFIAILSWILLILGNHLAYTTTLNVIHAQVPARCILFITSIVPQEALKVNCPTIG